MPEPILHPLATRIELNLPVNTADEICAVAEVMRRAYPLFQSATHNAYSILNPHTFEEFFLDGQQNAIINRITVLYIDVKQSIGDPDLNVNVAILDLIARQEYQRAGCQDAEISIVVHPLYQMA